MLTIEFARRERRLSQHQLGYMTHITPHLISLVENGRAFPTEEQAQRLARVLGVDVDLLLVPVSPPLPVASRG